MAKFHLMSKSEEYICDGLQSPEAETLLIVQPPVTIKRAERFFFQKTDSGPNDYYPSFPANAWFECKHVHYFKNGSIGLRDWDRAPSYDPTVRDYDWVAKFWQWVRKHKLFAALIVLAPVALFFLNHSNLKLPEAQPLKCPEGQIISNGACSCPVGSSMRQGTCQLDLQSYRLVPQPTVAGSGNVTAPGYNRYCGGRALSPQCELAISVASSGQVRYALNAAEPIGKATIEIDGITSESTGFSISVYVNGNIIATKVISDLGKGSHSSGFPYGDVPGLDLFYRNPNSGKETDFPAFDNWHTEQIPVGPSGLREMTQAAAQGAILVTYRLSRPNGSPTDWLVAKQTRIRYSTVTKI